MRILRAVCCCFFTERGANWTVSDYATFCSFYAVLTAAFITTLFGTVLDALPKSYWLALQDGCGALSLLQGATCEPKSFSSHPMEPT